MLLKFWPRALAVVPGLRRALGVNTLVVCVGLVLGLRLLDDGAAAAPSAICKAVAVWSQKQSASLIASSMLLLADFSTLLYHDVETLVSGEDMAESHRKGMYLVRLAWAIHPRGASYCTSTPLVPVPDFKISDVSLLAF